MSSAVRESDEKLIKLQADLDVGRSSRSGTTGSASGELEEKIAESLKKSLELGEDSELQYTRRELGEARQLAEVAEADCDCERTAFQVEKERLLRDLK